MNIVYLSNNPFTCIDSYSTNQECRTVDPLTLYKEYKSAIRLKNVIMIISFISAILSLVSLIIAIIMLTIGFMPVLRCFNLSMSIFSLLLAFVQFGMIFKSSKQGRDRISCLDDLMRLAEDNEEVDESLNEAAVLA